MLDKKKVVIGMSGGVDSTVAAYLLKKQGYDVIGITLKMWDDPAEDYAENYGGCCSLSSIEDARRAAANLDIPFYVLNFKKPFKEHVVDYFVSEYEDGRTPNPCIMCNKYIKFDLMLKKAHELGAYYVATGHYAKIHFDEESNRYRLLKSKEASKDQTYMLSSFTQFQLAHTLMPLGEYDSKEEVRAIAEELDLTIARKPDSQEICFIPDNDYATFVTEYSEKDLKPGKFVDKEGNILGEHKGIIYYTVGQRKGLGITFGKPMYVIGINPKKNTVILGSHEDVFSKGVVAKDVNLIAFDQLLQPIKVEVKIRHSKSVNKGILSHVYGDTYKIVFDQPARAVTPGQGITIYRGDEVVGGGFIQKALKNV